ncbi:Uncharacterized protein APZ42_012714 [Daphnia magna]|uniref:Uncharacterized protein n=1 Tax=Daphnia magna TaxID=35525 RepID=A0A162RJI6_9CRUS|nr:Uncharacterized protein APZ42_012714 [Daphnia magna]
MYRSSSDENDAENVEDTCFSNSDKKDIPAEFFEDHGEVHGKKASFYKFFFEGCKTKVKKYGTPKYLIVKNDSRYNAKRHFLAHDPHDKVGHKDKWRSAILKNSNKENVDVISLGPSVKLIAQQSDLDDWIMVVEKPGFRALVSSLAPHLKIRSRIFFTGMLVKKYHERQQQLKDALFNCTDSASTLDAGTCRRTVPTRSLWKPERTLCKNAVFAVLSVPQFSSKWVGDL